MTMTITETQDAKTHNAPGATESKANERLLALREQQEKQKAKLEARIAKLEQEARNAEGRDARHEEAKAYVRSLVDAEKARRVCLCGCGASTLAFFVPGHDARLLAATMRRLAGEVPAPVPAPVEKAFAPVGKPRIAKK